MKDKAPLILPLLLLSVIVGSVNAWTQVESSGSWTLCSPEHFIRNGTGITGYVAWNNSVSEFDGFWLMLHNVSWTNYREGWQFYTSQTFYIIVNITDASGTVTAVTRLKGETNFFGVLNTFHVLVGAFNSTWDDSKLRPPAFSNFDTLLWNPAEFQLFVIPESNQTKIVWIWNTGDQNVGYEATVDHVISGSATVTLTYRHEGDGYAEGYVATGFSLPALPSYQLSESNWYTAIQQSLGFLAPAVMILLAMIRIFFEMVKLSLPLLGAIVFLWIMDTIFTAITTGEVRLIGEMFLKIYDFVRAIWQTIAAIIEAIWDLITFWS